MTRRPLRTTSPQNSRTEISLVAAFDPKQTLKEACHCRTTALKANKSKCVALCKARSSSFAVAVAERPVRVFLADDHDVILRGVRSIVEHNGRYRVIGEGHDGREALRLICELDPDIAVLDYSLPEMNGLDLAHAVRRDNPGTSIVFYTINDQEEIISKVLRAGVRGYVIKTDPEQHLIDALDAISVGKPYFSPTVSDAVLARFLESKPIFIANSLSTRERETAQLVAEGMKNKEIAFRLRIATKTVETHRASAMRKLKLRTVADLVRWAVRTDLILP